MGRSNVARDDDGTQSLPESALRLLREKWASPEQLAQELYQIFADQPGGAIATAVPAVQARAEAAQKPPELPPTRRTPPALVVERAGRPVALNASVGLPAALPPAATANARPPRQAQAAVALLPAAPAIASLLAARPKLLPPSLPPPAPTPVDEDRSAAPAAARRDVRAVAAPTQQPAIVDDEPARGSPKPRLLGPDWNPPPLSLQFPLDWDFPFYPGGGTNTLYGQITSASPEASPSGSAFPAFAVQTFSGGSINVPDPTLLMVTMLGLNMTETIPIGTWIFGINSFADSQGNTFYEATLPMWLA
jgi:hypothetical protein